jgi:ketosteroid isomerase-like protein
MADDVEVTFLGQGTFHGIPAVRRFMAFSAGLLSDMEFVIGPLIIDGDIGATVGEETAKTRDGAPWSNHGVDVVRVRDGKIVALHENNDVRLVREHFPPYEG